MTQQLLDVAGVSRSFGGVRAVDDVSLSVLPGETVGLIGPNGAGKSTMLALIAGALRPDRGTVRFAGHDVTSYATAKRARLGLVRTFQAASPLTRMTVKENVLAGYASSFRAGAVEVLLRSPRMRREERAFGEKADELLEYCGLAADADRPAGELSFGRLRLLEVARVLAAGPRLLLLDEPGAGLNHVEIDRLAGLLDDVRARGTSVLVVDHDVSFLFSLCDRVTLLDFGRLILSGPAQQVRESEELRTVYLGEPS
ncbi:ABC transporter ATP-binding protein [Nocardia alni]|uniref:ABC transporter ATP-binding protein n=1 Tax=Nocardia alni TaxID=2815723 RepID=UPI001C2309C1|nr:ABC transporter ATP-binding protein [Nocardia alni]